METIEQILQLWKSDAEVDRTEPGNEIIKIPQLHSKYLNILIKHKMAAKRAHFDYLRMKQLRWTYYSGKMSQEELEEHGWEPFKYTLKSDIGTYIEADNNLIKLLEKKMYHDEAVSALELIMGELKQRNWEIRTFVDWEKFIGGN